MYQRILVPVDGSPTSLRGLDEAIRLARLTQGTLRLLHVVDELSFALGMDAYAARNPTGTADWLGMMREQGSAILQAAGERVRAAGVPFETELTDRFNERLDTVVAADAERSGADLIVIGTHGRRGAARLFIGSDAERILRGSPVPVLLVRDAKAAPPAEAASDTNAAKSAAGTPPPAASALPSAALAIE